MGYQSASGGFVDAFATVGSAVDYCATLCPRCADDDATRVIGELIADTNYPRRARAALRLHAMTETITVETLHRLWRDYRFSDSDIAKALAAMGDAYSWHPEDQVGHVESCEECNATIGYDWCACVACTREGDIGAESVYLESINEARDYDESVSVLCNVCINGGDATDTYQTVLGEQFGETITRYTAWIRSTFAYWQTSPKEYCPRLHGIGRFLGDERRAMIASAHVGELFPS